MIGFIFKVANQLINGHSNGSLQPIPPLSGVMSSRQLFNSSAGSVGSVDELNKNKSKENNFQRKLGFSEKYNDYSQRNGILKTIQKSNHSFPYESEIRKYSKHKIIPKPHPNPTSAGNDKYKYENNYQFPSTAQYDHSNQQSFHESSNHDTNEENNDNNNESTEDDGNGSDINADDMESGEAYDVDSERDSEDEEEDNREDKPIYSEEETPDCAFGNSFCYSDDRYPEVYMKESIDKQMDVLSQLMPESTDTFDLVDGIAKDRDEKYSYSEVQHSLDNSDSSELSSDESTGGYICPSYVNYIQPKRAQNNDGFWKVILNLNESYRGVEYKQHIRIEECIYERNGCNYSPNYFTTKCIQKFSNERLLAWTPDKGIHLDVFRLPIACSCHLTPNM